MYKHSTEFRVRYEETDRMGIVYHSNYIIWFDVGRTEFLRSIGYNYSDIEKEGVWLPIIEAGCKYKSPARYDDIVRVETYIEKLTRVKIGFGYKVYRGDELLVEGSTLQAFTNEKLKPIGISRLKPDLYEKLLAAADIK